MRDRTSFITVLAIETMAELTFTNQPVISMPWLKAAASKNIAKQKTRTFFIDILNISRF